jgi:hypothetical protein
MKAGDKCITSYRKDSSKIDYAFEICPKYGQNIEIPSDRIAFRVEIFFFFKRSGVGGSS